MDDWQWKEARKEFDRLGKEMEKSEVRVRDRILSDLSDRRLKWTMILFNGVMWTYAVVVVTLAISKHH